MHLTFGLVWIVQVGKEMSHCIACGVQVMWYDRYPGMNEWNGMPDEFIMLDWYENDFFYFASGNLVG